MHEQGRTLSNVPDTVRYAYALSKQLNHYRVTIDVARECTLHTRSGVIVPENPPISVVVTRTDFRCNNAGPRFLALLSKRFPVLSQRPVVFNF